MSIVSKNLGQTPIRSSGYKACFEANYLRKQIIGIDTLVVTPFGERIMTYCDYTASGRCLYFIENYIQRLCQFYANTHTEDDVTGSITSRLMHEAEEAIKAAVHAGPRGCLIACGTGATAAIDKLQQILGVAITPPTRARLENLLGEGGFKDSEFPIVFIGPYEHHSNEVTWRNSLVETVRIGLDHNGNIDLEELENHLRDPRYSGRTKIGSFSAASNVTGIRTDIYQIATLLHKFGAFACFDFAACGPYVDIDMNPEARKEGDDPSLDAIFLSPHKFLGGPGASGILVFNEALYQTSLPPTVCGGGTVDYVGLEEEDFIRDIEERERAGTPGILQMLKAGLVFQLKDRVGLDTIHTREQAYLRKIMAVFADEPRIEVLGHPEPERRVGIVSFNVRASTGKYLHHKFVSKLLNDLFGIQSRAGCSCAGPYGHELLSIDHLTSEAYRQVVREGQSGFKPGWCRIGLHWVMDEAEVDFVIHAICLVARIGELFLPLYDFSPQTGVWIHKGEEPTEVSLTIESAFEEKSFSASPSFSTEERSLHYAAYLEAAEQRAEDLRSKQENQQSIPVEHPLQFFQNGVVRT